MQKLLGSGRANSHIAPAVLQHDWLRTGVTQRQVAVRLGCVIDPNEAAPCGHALANAENRIACRIGDDGGGTDEWGESTAADVQLVVRCCRSNTDVSAREIDRTCRVRGRQPLRLR